MSYHEKPKKVLFHIAVFPLRSNGQSVYGLKDLQADFELQAQVIENCHAKQAITDFLNRWFKGVVKQMVKEGWINEIKQ